MSLRLKAALGVVALLASAGVVTASPASAIIGGVEDTANRYANVGLVVFYEPTGRFRCSGTLVSPRVVLTAAHCTADTIGKTIISFDPVIDRQPPANIPRAPDDTGNGLSRTGYTTAPAGYVIGTPHAHPQYSNFTDLANWNDVGVIVLDTPVTTITPAPLAPTNYLNQFAQQRLRQQLFRVVGYGVEIGTSRGPGKPAPISFPIVRRYTDSAGQKLTPQILQVNGNPNDNRGGGGACFGDSGGPSFKNGYVTTVTSYVLNLNCRYISGLQRVDIPVVQSWLATFGVRPAAAAA